MSFFKNLLTSNHQLHKVLVERHREKIKSLKAKMNLNRSFTDKVADFLTDSFGTVLFLSLNAAWFLIWMLINTNLIPFFPNFDPFPYGLLTMIVSLEAIFLAIIVLISQNRSAKIAELREEIDLQINVKAEEEITRILVILDQIHDHLGLEPQDDDELITMKQKTNLEAIEDELEREMLQK